MDDQAPPGSDPGWSIDAKSLLYVVAPMLGARRLASAASGLIAIRRLFVSFVLMTSLVGVVVLFLWSGSGSETADYAVDATVMALVVFVVGLAGVVGSWRMQRELPCDDIGVLLVAYRTRFSLRMAFAELSALLGFVGFFLSGNPVASLVGMGPAVLGFAALAPTRTNLEREDEAMRLRGCTVTIYPALLALE